MNSKNNKKHITALMAAMAMAGTSSVFAAPGLVENPQVGVVYVSANDAGDQPNAQIRFGQNSTTGGGGAAVNNTTIASLATADVQRNLVFTPLNNVEPTLTNETKGGLLIDPTTGNTTVKQGSSTLDSILPGLVRVRQQEVWSNDASVPAADRGVATGTPASTVYGTLNGSTFTPLTLSAGTQAAIEAFVAAPTSANAEALMNQINSDPADRVTLAYTSGAPTVNATTGNFTVEGSTTTKGITNTGAISTDSLTVGGVAAATVNDVTAETTRATTRENQIESDSVARDGVLQGNINTVQSNLNTEVAERSGLIRNVAAGAAGSTQGAYNEIHIGANSLVTYVDSAAQQQVLTTTEANGIRVQGNLAVNGTLSQNGVNVATVNDVAAEALTRANADVALQNSIAAEAATRASADSTLQANIDAEVAARVADVNAEESRALAAEAALSGRATALESRATALESRTSSLEGRMGNAEREIRSLRKGIAMAAALQTPVIDHGDKQAVKVGAATYDGEQGLGLGYAVRVGDSVTLNVDVATGFPETVARGGVNLSF